MSENSPHAYDCRFNPEDEHPMLDATCMGCYHLAKTMEYRNVKREPQGQCNHNERVPGCRGCMINLCFEIDSVKEKLAAKTRECVALALGVEKLKQAAQCAINAYGSEFSKRWILGLKKCLSLPASTTAKHIVEENDRKVREESVLWAAGKVCPNCSKKPVNENGSWFHNDMPCRADDIWCAIEAEADKGSDKK